MTVKIIVMVYVKSEVQQSNSVSPEHKIFKDEGGVRYAEKSPLDPMRKQVSLKKLSPS
jgi:hypothetical protein